MAGCPGRCASPAVCDAPFSGLDRCCCQPLQTARGASLRAVSNHSALKRHWVTTSHHRSHRAFQGTVVVSAIGKDTVDSFPKPALYEGLERPIGAPGTEYHALFALAIFAIAYTSHVHLDSFTLFKAFAIFQMFNSAAAIIFNNVEYDKIGSVVAPAVLAVFVTVPSLDPGNVALSILGTYLSKELKVVPFWPTALSLAVALYFGVGNQWVTLAYALLSSVGLVSALQKRNGVKNNKAVLAALPVLAATAFVFWEGITPLWAVSLGLGEVVRSVYGLIDQLTTGSPTKQ